MDVGNRALPMAPRDTPSQRSHCPYCALQCGIHLTAQPDGQIDVEGDAAFPTNRGQLCIKGFNAAGLLSAPGRWTAPQIRRADGAYDTVSWSTALDHVAGELDRLRAESGPDALAMFGSGGLTNEKAYALGKFARVVLHTRFIDYNGRYCMASAASALQRSLGLDRGLPFPLDDIPKLDVALVWGSNLADTLPPIMQWFSRLLENGGDLIVVDPRRTATAQAGTLHLQNSPGSDLALANGLLFVAVEEGLIDEAFIEERTRDWDQVRRLVLGYWPSRVERITGIGEARLRDVARRLARASRAALFSGRGPEQQSKGVDTVLAFVNLMLALGKVGRPGSGYGCLTGQGNGQGGREHGQKADQLPGYRLIDDPEHRQEIARVWGVDPATLPSSGVSATELMARLGAAERGGGGVRGLLVHGSNLAVASPDVGRVRERLASLDLLVVTDCFENDTSASAHVRLPTYQWSEEAGTMTNLEGRVILRRPVTQPPAGARNELWILSELASRLGAEERFRFATAEDAFAELRRATAGAVADYSGISYEKIERQGGVFWPCPTDDHPGTPRPLLERFGHGDGLARFHAVEHRPAGEEPDAEYPYFFTTGRYREHYNSGAQTRRVEALRVRRPLPCLQVHPATLRAVGLYGARVVRVESRRGHVDFTVEMTRDIRPDTVFAPFHWGGRDSANVLTNGALDPKSRMPEFKICAVRLVAPPSSPAGKEPRS